MNKDLIIELMALLAALNAANLTVPVNKKKLTNPALWLSRILRTYGSEKLRDELDCRYPNLPDETHPVPAITAAVAAKPARKLPKHTPAKSQSTHGFPRVKKPVPVVDPNLTTVNLGPYSSRHAADQDAMQFKNPNVFFYRSALFPLPGNYGIQAEVVETQVLETGVPLKPFSIRMSVRVTGPELKVQAWITSFQARARSFIV